MPLIRCKLHRHGGTHISFGTGKTRVDYHFKELNAPKDSKHNDDRVDHVCEVTDPDHAAHLVNNIKEGYELVEGEKVAAAPMVTAKTKKPAGSKKAGAGDPVPTAANKEIAKMNMAELLAAVAAKQGGKAPHPSTSAAKLREILSQPQA